MTSPAVIPATHFLCPMWRLYLFDYRSCSVCAHRRGNLCPDSADWKTKRLAICRYTKRATATQEKRPCRKNYA